MIQRVIGYLVALGAGTAYQHRVAARLIANDEKSGADTGCRQHVQYLRRPARVGTIIEGEMDW